MTTRLTKETCHHCGGCVCITEDEHGRRTYCLSCGRGHDLEPAQPDTGGSAAMPVNEFRNTRRGRYNSPYHGIFPSIADPDGRGVPV